MFNSKSSKLKKVKCVSTHKEALKAMLDGYFIQPEETHVAGEVSILFYYNEKWKRFCSRVNKEESVFDFTWLEWWRASYFIIFKEVSVLDAYRWAYKTYGSDSVYVTNPLTEREAEKFFNNMSNLYDKERIVLSKEEVEVYDV